MGELRTLRLLKDIEYQPYEGDIPDEAEEWAEFHDFKKIFSLKGPDGPEALPPSKASLISKGCRLPGPDPSAARGDGTAIRAGVYLFRQLGRSGRAEPQAVLRDFIRDAWWEGKNIGELLILRHVREDGKEALQILSPLRSDPGAG
jgi:hypothetical protein